MKINEYKTATADNCAALDAVVNKMLAQGFQVYGSPYAASSRAGDTQVAQAMVRCGMRENMEPVEVLPQSAVAP